MNRLANDLSHEHTPPKEPHMTSPILAALYEGNDLEAQRMALTARLTLPEAAAAGLDGECRRLLDSGASPLAPSPDGWPPLHLAAFFGRVAVVGLLLERNAPITQRATSEQGNTALHACLAGRFDLAVFAALLDAGCDVNASDAQQVRPIHLAAARGYVEVLEALHMRGAILTAPLPAGDGCVDLARQRGHLDAAAWLERRLHDGAAQ
jgi:uncharacterized protein